MNEIVLYLWTKFRTIPFIVLLGILQSDLLFVRISLSHCVAVRVLCFLDKSSPDWFVFR